jgi:hypothetical protein
MTCDDPWKAAMRRGDLAAAWAIGDAVLKRRLEAREVCWRWPRHLQFIWRGEPLMGKRILVRCYHGLGDTIQFLRFMRPLRAIARHVTVWVQSQLLDLAATAAGVDEVIALHDGSSDADYDSDIEIMEVPHALRLSSIPCQVPYLTASPVSPRPKTGNLRIGIVWQGGDWDTRRNLPRHLLERISDVSGIRLFSLQIGEAARSSQIPSIVSDCETIGKTAERMHELDLIISVDTMAAHLAGALAVPVWTLLHAECDWRWGEDETHSAWYPTMRLFRQRRSGDWSAVIGQVCQVLASHSQDRTSGMISPSASSSSS